MSGYPQTIDTLYGPVPVEHPVILDIIASKAFQRLRHIRQYGHYYYVFNQAELSRYDHSLGVWALVTLQGCSLREQVAALLHDISHTIFSHLGDWLFDYIHAEMGYADSIQEQFLYQNGLAEILHKHGLSVGDICPFNGNRFPALEQSCPEVCADRMDNNIQTAFHHGIISQEEAREAAHTLSFVDGRWISSSPLLIKKICENALFMNRELWSSVPGYVSSAGLAAAIHRGVEIGILSVEDIHFGTDHNIWQVLKSSSDPFIQTSFLQIETPDPYYSLANIPIENSQKIYLKFRGVDPWVLVDNECLRLTAYDTEYQQAFEKDRLYFAEDKYLSISPPHHAL